MQSSAEGLFGTAYPLKLEIQKILCASLGGKNKKKGITSSVTHDKQSSHLCATLQEIWHFLMITWIVLQSISRTTGQNSLHD